MNFDPRTEGWREVSSAGNFTLIGPLWQKGEGEGFRIGLQIDERHTNINNKVHGGVILGLADQALGRRLLGETSGLVQATVEMNVQFIAAGNLGDFIEGSAEVVRRSRTLGFVRGQLCVGSRIIATAQGLWTIRPNEGEATR